MTALPRRSSGLRPLLGALAAAVALGGCASTPLSPNRDLEAEVRELRQRVVELQRQAAVDQIAIDELRRKVEALEGGRPAPVSTRAPVRSAPPAERVEPPPERVEPAPRRSPPGAEPVREARPPARLPEPLGADVEESDLEEPPAIERRNPPPGPGGAGTQAGAQAAGGAPIPPAGQALYDRGYTLYHQGRYLDAEASFQRFLQAHGDTDLADNAQYWIGEARYARGDVRGALAAFRETVSRYPEGNKVPDALLKAGQSLEQLGDREGARTSYREVGQRFPGSAAAVVAQERLAQLP